ncbi:hypothetical protein [Streptomyces sp. NPDC049555]|uniref:hypothetical protein n=1 Tax=Streptomyces sp. NPDC049555 TaxID=3154930 RepID=UPI0034385A50
MPNGFDGSHDGDHTLSKEEWILSDRALNKETVSLLSERLHNIIDDLVDIQSGITEEQLIDPGFEGIIPSGWRDSQGSPAFFIRAAISHLRAAAEGTICYNQTPPSPYRRVPPDNILCCSHKPKRHCY